MSLKRLFIGWPSIGRRSAVRASASASAVTLKETDDPLQAFDAERRGHGEAAALRPSRMLLWAGAATVVLVSAALGGMVALWKPWPFSQPVAAASGNLRVETRPAGGEVLVDGQPRGAAPVTLALDSGVHSVTVSLGEELKQAGGAKLTVMSDPPGAQVHLDGVALGVTPLTVPAAAPATHRVAVVGTSGSVERTLALEKDANASIVFALPKAAAAPDGWVAIAAPFEVQVRDDGEVIATGRAMKLALAARSHVLTLTSDVYQFHETRRIEVVAGRSVPLRIDPPRTTLSANARPWADVLIDGVPVGQTPISNLPVTVGPHDVVFRHPQFGERPQTIAVTVRGPNRIAVDLTK